MNAEPHPGWLKKVGHSFDRQMRKVRDGAVKAAGPAIVAAAVAA